jgi:protein-tyrosine phosphatase
MGMFSLRMEKPQMTLRFHNDGMTKIWERLYLGCFYDAESLKENPKDITAVLNVTQDRLNFNGTHAHDLVLWQNSTWEDGFQIKRETFWEMLGYLKDCLFTKETVLVHCHAGWSRSPSIVAAYMHISGFQSFDKALEYVKLLRPHIKPSNEVVRSIKQHLQIWPYDGTYERDY